MYSATGRDEILPRPATRKEVELTILSAILKEISPGISLEGKMLKLKLQYFGHLMRRVDSLEKTLMSQPLDKHLSEA